jgi:hypothetical protein
MTPRSISLRSTSGYYDPQTSVASPTGGPVTVTSMRQGVCEWCGDGFEAKGVR